jgi:hypothetical protein
VVRGRSSCCTTRTRLQFSRSRRSSRVFGLRRKVRIHRLGDENLIYASCFQRAGLPPRLQNHKRWAASTIISPT